MLHLRPAGLAFVCVLLLTLRVATCGAQAPRSVAERYLFQAANQERLIRGLPSLEWDPILYRAALFHVRQMAAHASISHRYGGEPELASRAEIAGVRFSVVAENVAEAPTALMIHHGWMESEHHRENLLDPRLTRIAISVVRQDGQLFAVEDFDRATGNLSIDVQEKAVADLLSAAAPLRVGTGSIEARDTCDLDTGFAGPRRPWFVVRFTASDLTALPEVLLERVAQGKYHEAQVGACSVRHTEQFSGYSIAVLLYP